MPEAKRAVLDLQALGKGRPAFILAFARDFFYISALFVLSKYFGFSGFVYVQPFAHIFTFLLAIALFNMIKSQITDEHREWEIKNSIDSVTAKVPKSAEKYI